MTHVQKSVFEGDLSEGKVALLKRDLKSSVDMKRDFVIIYTLSEGSKIQRDIFTDTPDPTDNFI